MKLKLFSGNSKAETIHLNVLGGGYDQEVQRVVIVVRGDNESVGSVSFDIAEARRISTMLITDTPEVTRVGVVVDASALMKKGEQ